MIDHHAVLYITQSSTELPAVVTEIELTYESTRFFLSTLTIKDVRTIIERAYQMPFASPVQYILINTDTIPTEAQNALLKILEEPPLTTRFVVIVRPQTMILPTLQSRLMRSEQTIHVLANPIFDDFLAAQVPDRLATISSFAKDKNDAGFQELYRGLISYVSQSAGGIKTAALAPHLGYLQLRGASKKMIWEDIALQVPVGSA